MKNIRFCGDEEAVEPKATKPRKVENPVDGARNVPIGAFENIDSASVLLDKELHLQRICRHNGVIIGREGFLDNGRHSLEADAAGVLFDLPSNGEKTAGVFHFVPEAAHSGVIISPAEDAKEVGAGNHQATRRSQHSREFADEIFGFVHVF